jgi:hypothetical protein
VLTPLEGVDARQQLPEVERLDRVVLAACIKSLDAVRWCVQERGGSLVALSPGDHADARRPGIRQSMPATSYS